MAIRNRPADGVSGLNLEQLERRIAYRAVRDAFEGGPTQAEIDAEDKSLTDAFNKAFGANISYGTDGYDSLNIATTHAYTKPTSQDKALTKILNNEFGGHVSFATDHHNLHKENLKLDDYLTSMATGSGGFSTTGSGSAADQDKALTEEMNSLFGTSLGASTGATPSDADFKTQDASLTETINRLLGTNLKPAG